MSEMRAARYHEYGAPEVLRVEKVPIPEPGPGELLVKVHAAGVNPFDATVRSGALRLMTGRKFPHSTGLDFAGEVVASGGSTPGFEIGDPVWGEMPLKTFGSAAEFLVIAHGALAHSPRGLDAVNSAALPVVGVTALLALRDRAHLRAGERLLVRGATGGVGSIAVQIGRNMGAEVTALVSSRNMEFARELGANQVFDYATTPISELGPFDVILDTVGSDLPSFRSRLAPHGRMFTIAIDPKAPIKALFYIGLSTLFGKRRVRFFSAKATTALLCELARSVESGLVKPIVDQVYPLTEIAAAHRTMEQGGRRGKQILSML